MTQQIKKCLFWFQKDLRKKVIPPATVNKAHATVNKTQTTYPAPLSLGAKTSGGDKAAAADGLLDIRTLREKSRNMDLPLISALCNDRSLLKQTNAFVMPRHPSDRPVSWHVETSPKKSEVKTTPTVDPTTEGTPKKSFLSSLLSSKSVSDPNTPVKHSYSTASKVKYPVSGLSTTQIVKSSRKTVSRHTHPQETKVAKVGRSKSTSSATTSCANITDTILPQ